MLLETRYTRTNLCSNLLLLCISPIVSMYRRYVFISAAKNGRIETITDYISANKIQHDIDAMQLARINAIIADHSPVNDIITRALANHSAGHIIVQSQEPLEYAICNKMEREALRLIHLQEVPSQFSSTMKTPYELAAQYGLEMVQIALIDHNVSADKLLLPESSDAVSPLMHAYKSNQFNLAQVIIRKLKLDSRDIQEILQDAFKNRRSPIILALLEHEAAYRLVPKKIFPHYISIAKIGNGSYGEVYEVLELVTKKRFAVKHTAELEGFLNEVFILTRLKNEHVVNYIGSSYEGTNYSIAYEILDGNSLDKFYAIHICGKIIDDERINLISGLLNQLLDGLKFLETESVIHFDLHMGNVMLQMTGNKSYRVKIIDFGKARIMGMIPQSDALAGALQFAAPETFENNCFARVSTKHDVFSYGVIAYTMATSAQPFPIYAGWQDYPHKTRQIFYSTNYQSKQKSHLWPPSINHKYTSFRDQVDAALEKNVAKRPLASKLPRLQCY